MADLLLLLEKRKRADDRITAVNADARKDQYYLLVFERVLGVAANWNRACYSVTDMMESGIQAQNIILPTLYALLWADYALLFFRNDPFAERTAKHLLRITVGAHAIYLVMRSVTYHHFPFATVFEAFSVLAFSVIALYLVIESRIGVRTTGFFIIGIVFVFQIISSAFVEAPESFSDLLWEPAFILHVTTALLGYSGMAISAVYGLLYLMLFYDIKKHRFGLIYKQLPSLEVMSSFTYRSATLGLVFLTIAMVGGLALLVRVYGTYWSWDPKLMITFVAWLIYGLCVAASRFWGWSAKRVAFTSIAGFAVILFSLIVVNLVFTRFHEFV